jgi:hypothetical protein
MRPSRGNSIASPECLPVAMRAQARQHAQRGSSGLRSISGTMLSVATWSTQRSIVTTPGISMRFVFEPEMLVVWE